MQRKKILFVFRRAPFDGNRPSELLDAAMMAAAFGQEVELAFLDDGVFLFSADPQTMKGQFDELGDSDIDHIWVERDSLVERRLTLPAGPLPLDLLDRSELTRIIAGADAVVSG
ncbi:MAG TPA: hypothetical protein HPQ04_01435 [Rhodospirillaceae bacterium]|nr:hypothetical protein [Rhodospirillaceae bacterium]